MWDELDVICTTMMDGERAAGADTFSMEIRARSTARSCLGSRAFTRIESFDSAPRSDNQAYSSRRLNARRKVRPVNVSLRKSAFSCCRVKCGRGKNGVLGYGDGCF